MNTPPTAALQDPNAHSILLLLGVGGAGSNAAAHMYQHGGHPITFAISNTDAQALADNPIPHKLQLGPHLTHGLGAGANPEIGKHAALESKEAIKELLGTQHKMLFLIAGMGGGTGTGGAPIIAQVAKKQGLLVVGIVTYPFAFEGPQKQKKAEEGIQDLKKHCDIVLVILNERLREGLQDLSIRNAFTHADEVMGTCVASISKIITSHGYVNVDFEDVRTVIAGAGTAVMGSGIAEGEERSILATQQALHAPLLEPHHSHGAQKVLLSILSGPEGDLTMNELTRITERVQAHLGQEAEVIFGHGYDDKLGSKLRVTIIATGFDTLPHTEPLAASPPPQRRSAQANPPEQVVTAALHQKLKDKKYYLRERADSLVNSLKPGEKYRISEEEIREKLSVPAYKRKNISLAYKGPQGPAQHYLELAH